MKQVTLKTLHLATPQEVFDQVATHLLTQMKRSMDDSLTGCLYRGEEDLKCAAGCLISDEEYSKEFEDKDWDDLIKFKMVPKSHQTLIRDLQLVHDQYIRVDDWYEKLKHLATDHGLEFNKDYVKEN